MLDAYEEGKGEFVDPFVFSVGPACALLSFAHKGWKFDQRKIFANAVCTLLPDAAKAERPANTGPLDHPCLD